MEILRQALLFLHFVGLAVLIGGFLGQMAAARKEPTKPGTGMLHGALTQLVTGILLVGVNEGLDKEVDDAKVGVKLLVLLVILGVIIAGRRRPLATAAFFSIGALALVNVAIAVFWT